MRHFVILIFISAIFGYPQNYEVTDDTIEYRNIPEYFNKPEHLLFQLGLSGEIYNIISEVQLQDKQAIINEYADKIIKNIRLLMIQNDLDSFTLPDQHAGFNYTMVITYYGEVNLTHGSIKNLVSVHRAGDVTVNYSSNKYLTLTLPIAFDKLSFTYDYSAKIMNLGPTGGVEGTVDGIVLDVKVGFNTSALEASLDYFNIRQAGTIDFHFTGLPLIDWLLNLLTKVVTTLLKGVILFLLNNVIRGGIQVVVDAINAIISGLDPTEIAPAAIQFFK